MRKPFGVSLILLFCLAATLLQGVTTEKPNLKLRTPSLEIPLKHPIIRVDGIAYFNVRDWAKFTKGKLSYSRRTDTYTLAFSDPNPVSITLTPNDTAVLLNNNETSLQKPTLMHKQELYAPLFPFFLKLGYYIDKDSKGFVIAKNKRTLPSVSPKTAPSIALTPPQTASPPDTPSLEPSSIPSPNQGELLASFAFKKSAHNGLPLPSFNKGDRFSIGIALSEYDLDVIAIDDKGRALVNLFPALEKEGFQILIDPKLPNRLTLKKQALSKTFTSTPYQNLTLIPLEQFLDAFGYGHYWYPNKEHLQLLSRLTHLQLTQDKAGLILNLHATDRLLSAEPVASTLRKGFYIDIPFAKIDKPNAFFFENTSPLLNASFQQKDETTVRMTLMFRSSIGYFPLLSHANGGDIRFFTSIRSLSEKQGDKTQTLTFTGNGQFAYKSWLDRANKKLIIDIPETVSQLPLIHRSNNPVYHRVRSSQKSYDPPITRIVVDLKEDAKPVFSQPNDRSLQVAFSQTPSIVKPSPKPSKPKAKPKPVVRSKGLAGKVIVIDPGHGGADPGAVPTRRIYEKIYTLDIAKRLEKRLKEEGAFVILTRRQDRSVSLRSRAYIANKNKADALVSVHINSFKTDRARGTETYYYKNRDKRLATLLQKEMVSTLGLRNLGVKRSRMYVLRNSRMPAALVEPMFMTNPKELKLVRNPDYRQKIADALFRGLQRYFKS